MAATDPDNEFLTVAEVAAMLKLNQQTVRNWIDQGTLSALRIGRRVRIRRADLDRLLGQDYRAAGPAVTTTVHLSAEDFWGGEPVGSAVNQPDPAEVDAPAQPPDESGTATADTSATSKTDATSDPDPHPGPSEAGTR